MQRYLNVFSKKIILPPFFFTAMLIFCVNAKMHLSSKCCKIARFRPKFLSRGFMQRHLTISFSKNHSKNTFISECFVFTVQKQFFLN